MVEAAVGALVAAEVFGGIAATIESFAGGGVCLVLGLVAVLLAALKPGCMKVMGAAVVGEGLRIIQNLRTCLNGCSVPGGVERVTGSPGRVHVVVGLEPIAPEIEGTDGEGVEDGFRLGQAAEITAALKGKGLGVGAGFQRGDEDHGARFPALGPGWEGIAGEVVSNGCPVLPLGGPRLVIDPAEVIEGDG